MDTIKKATMLIHNTILKILFLTSIIGVLFDCIKSPRLNIIRYLIVSQNQSIKKIDFLRLYPTFIRLCGEVIFLKLDAVFRIQFVHKYVTIKILFILGGSLWITTRTRTRIKTKIRTKIKTRTQIKNSIQIRIIHTVNRHKALFLR